MAASLTCALDLQHFLHPVVGNSACWPHKCDLGLLQSWALKPDDNNLPTVTNYVSFSKSCTPSEFGY